MHARLTTLVALCILVLPPAQAVAAKLESFKLPSPVVDPAAPGGKLEDDRIAPKVNVLLPDGYEADSRRRYPVLWALHGANGGTDTWIPDIRQLAAGLPAIVVMPDGGVFGMYMDWWNGGVRGNPAWATYHLKLLRRTIERRYRIRAGRRWHAIAGISMGGQGALRYSALLPGYFGSAIGLSAALPDVQALDTQFGVSVLPLAGGASGVSYEAIWGPAGDAYAEGNSPQALVPNYAHTRLYLTSGNGVNCPGDPPTGTFAVDIVTESFINAQQGPFAAAARAAGAEVTEVTTCGIHTFGVWDRAFPLAREWGFFRPVPERPRSWTYRTVATSGEMWGLRFRFDEPPAEVAEFERSGQRLAGAGTGTVRIRGRGDCTFSADLPFELPLPRACVGPA